MKNTSFFTKSKSDLIGHKRTDILNFFYVLIGYRFHPLKFIPMKTITDSIYKRLKDKFQLGYREIYHKCCSLQPLLKTLMSKNYYI